MIVAALVDEAIHFVRKLADRAEAGHDVPSMKISDVLDEGELLKLVRAIATQAAYDRVAASNLPTPVASKEEED